MEVYFGEKVRGYTNLSTYVMASKFIKAEEVLKDWHGRRRKRIISEHI